MANEAVKSNSDYNAKIHTLGRISTVIALLGIIFVPAALTVLCGEAVDFGVTASAFLAAFMMFGVVGVVEFISYAPILGAGAQYLSFITGNIMNMKVPAVVSGLKLAKVEQGTPEADCISVISAAVSSLVTTAIVTVGVLLATQLEPVLSSPTLAPAFDNLMPAIMGALMTPVMLKDIKTASVPCIAALLMTLLLGYTTMSTMQTFMIPVFLIIAVAWKYVLMKMEAKSAK